MSSHVPKPFIINSRCIIRVQALIIINFVEGFASEGGSAIVPAVVTASTHL
jgi:hypothetical protein